MATGGKQRNPLPTDNVNIRGTMPACISRRYLKENPVDGSLYYSEVVVMLAHAWERSPESSDPSWDVIAFKFFVIAHRDLF